MTTKAQAHASGPSLKLAYSLDDLIDEAIAREVAALKAGKTPPDGLELLAAEDAPEYAAGAASPRRSVDKRQRPRPALHTGPTRRGSAPASRSKPVTEGA